MGGPYKNLLKVMSVSLLGCDLMSVATSLGRFFLTLEMAENRHEVVSNFNFWLRP
jgi:hypothetical protein